MFFKFFDGRRILQIHFYSRHIHLRFDYRIGRGKVKEEGMGKSDLQRAIEVLEDAGFHVDTAHEENYRDAGHTGNLDWGSKKMCDKTGAICLRITPVRLFEPLLSDVNSRKPARGRVNDVY
jgi:hypothetical protein